MAAKPKTPRAKAAQPTDLTERPEDTIKRLAGELGATRKEADKLGRWWNEERERADRYKAELERIRGMAIAIKAITDDMREPRVVQATDPDNYIPF